MAVEREFFDCGLLFIGYASDQSFGKLVGAVKKGAGSEFGVEVVETGLKLRVIARIEGLDERGEREVSLEG